MSRPLRVEYSGAIYHVMSRGNRRERIFRGEADYQLMLTTLGEACQKTGWQVHAWCLMSNHFHLVIETPAPNLVAGMKWLLGVYTRQASVPTIYYSFTTNTAGDLASIAYTDSTPGVTKTYDRLGRLKTTVQNGVTTTLAYNDAGQPVTESYSGGLLSGVTVSNAYDGFLRRTGLAVYTNINYNPIYLTTFGYDAASRLKAVTNGANTAEYSYVDNSPLVSTITYKQNGTTRMTTTKQWDLLNRLTNIVTTTNAVAVNRSAYAYNLASQRTRNTQADGSYWAYQYDNLGQVTSGRKYWSDGSPVAGQQFDYTFDDIGNRKTAWEGGDASGSNLRQSDYAANALNQYTQRAVPGYIVDIGAANSNAAVTVNNRLASRKGEYFWREIAVSNAAAPVWQTLTNYAGLVSNSVDLLTTNTGSVFVPQTPETFNYDLDGNLTSDGRWTNAWDAENRLLTQTARTTVGLKERLAYEYDSQGRRIHKQAWTNWNGSTGTLVLDQKYIYDGWNLLAILNTNNAPVATFTWGLDLGGSMQSAGGVGGALWLSAISNSVTLNSSYYSYDGNGNVAALIDSATGTNTAVYEYSPFGQTLRATGPMALANPLRFSTKYTDDQTDWLYYGYRYYIPAIGRWPSRDPIEEQGGKNLYEFVGNLPIGHFDCDGLYTVEGSSSLPGDAAGKTEFNPQIIVQSVKTNWCCCSLVQATWKANTVVLYPSDPNSPVFQIPGVTLTGILAHEGAHASADDALAAKALPAAISALQGGCTQKGKFVSFFSPNWSYSSCMDKMQAQADAASAYIKNLGDGMLQDKAHSFFGATVQTWNPAGVSQWQNWFNGWLAGQFNGGQYW